MKLKEPLANPPAGFSLTNPPRIAFDLPNTVNALGKSSQEFKEGELRGVRIGQTPSRTRVVLNLDKPARFNTALDGQNLLITLQSGAAAASAAEPTHFADAEAQPSSRTRCAASTSSAAATAKARSSSTCPIPVWAST